MILNKRPIEGSYSKRLTGEQVREAYLKALDGGKTLVSIAKGYNISSAYIRSIRDHKSRQDITQGDIIAAWVGSDTDHTGTETIKGCDIQ